MSERVFTFPTYDLAQSILGQHNRYLQMMNEVIPADIVSRGDTVVIKGDELHVEALYRTLEELVFLYKEGSTITESQVRDVYKRQRLLRPLIIGVKNAMNYHMIPMVW